MAASGHPRHGRRRIERRRAGQRDCSSTAYRDDAPRPSRRNFHARKPSCADPQRISTGPFAYDFWHSLTFPDVYELTFNDSALAGVRRLWSDGR